MAANQATQNLISTAWRVGCPSDQLRNFLGAGYCPQPKQLEFHAAARLCDDPAGPDQVGFGGARGPGKSFAIFSQIALDDARRFPDCKILYLRKAAKQAREQFQDLARKVLRHVDYRPNWHSGVVELWQESHIYIGHFRNESDVDRYLGLEYDIIAIEEATTLSQAKYKTLRDSNRTSKPNLRPRIYASTNPGGIGHSWFKGRFIEPWRDGGEAYTRFIPATIEDNRFVDEGYRRRLEENVGWKLRAYRYGDWDIAAGQFFTNWRRDVHVVKGFAPLPLDWRYWAAMDYGITHPTVVYLGALDGDGNLYVIDEHRQAKWLVNQHADAIRAMLQRHGVDMWRLEAFVAGGDVFAKWSTGRTIADEYAQCGITLQRANSDRMGGAARMLELLGDVAAGRQPRLYIFDRCTALIECMPALEHDPNRPEDVLKVDVDEDGNGGDDAYDAARYLIMAAPSGGSFAIKYR